MAQNKIYFVFLNRFDKTNNSYLQSESQNLVDSFAKVCKNNLPDNGLSSLGISKDALNGYLCNLVSKDVS